MTNVKDTTKLLYKYINERAPNQDINIDLKLYILILYKSDEANPPPKTLTSNCQQATPAQDSKAEPPKDTNGRSTPNTWGGQTTNR